MAYENSYLNDDTSIDVSSSDNKQIIFRQIDQELLSQKPRHNVMAQRTHSNYAFIIFVDLIALVSAILGVYLVYNIFQEQQIRLVSGQQGVRVLESTLLAEINKQYSIDLANKEQELQNVRNRLVEVETEYSNTIARIQEESQIELQRQRQALVAEIESQLVGKNDQEREDLQRQYDERLQQVEAQIREQQLERERLERERFEQIQQQEQQAINDTELQSQVTEAQRRYEETQAELERVRLQQQEENDRLIATQSQFDSFDRSISDIFLSVQEYLRQSNYTMVRESLNDIQRRYDNANIALNQNRRNADLFVVSLLGEYIDNIIVTTNLQELSRTQIDSISNLETILQNQRETSISREQIQDFMSLISNTRNTRTIRQRTQVFEMSIPNLLSFAEYYISFARNNGVPNIEELINRGDNFVNNRQYREAVNTYRQILRIYSLDDRAGTIIQKLYDTIILDLQASGALDNSNIPVSVEGDVQRLLDSQETSQIVYMQQPDGYVADIVNKDTAIVILLSQKRINARQSAEVFRLRDNYQMDKIGEFTSQRVQKDTFQVVLTNHSMQLGDLVYIKK